MADDFAFIVGEADADLFRKAAHRLVLWLADHVEVADLSVACERRSAGDQQRGGALPPPRLLDRHAEGGRIMKRKIPGQPVQLAAEGTMMSAQRSIAAAASTANSANTVS